MGFFKNIGRGFRKLGKGIKQGVGKVAKGVKAVSDFGKKVGFVNPIATPDELKKQAEARGGKRLSFGKQIVSGFTDSATRTFKNLQAPTKLVKAIDPLRNTGVGKAGFSPISLVADIVTAPVTSIGVMGQALVDKERQKKIKSGDFDTIADLALAPVAFVGTGLAGGATKAVGKAFARAGIKSGAKQVGRGLGKTAVKGTAKVLPKSQASKVAGKFDESTIKFKPIKDIPKTKSVPKQTLTKAQRLKQAKTAIKTGQRITKQF